jgi:hypothetical protein
MLRDSSRRAINSLFFSSNVAYMSCDGEQKKTLTPPTHLLKFADKHHFSFIHICIYNRRRMGAP